MKANHISDVTKILILAATTIITCIIVAIGLNAARTAKSLTDTVITQISDLNRELEDSDLKKYDNAYIDGSEVVNFIKRYLGDYSSPDSSDIYVYVKTNKSTNTYINGDYLDNIRDFTHNYYIKPTAIFFGEVVINKNGVILGVKFTQQ